MPLDHYVSQVHLRNFYSPILKGMMYAIRKSDLKGFTARSQDVCRIENNSTNPYLTNERAIEEFLKSVEPKYNASLGKLRDNKIDQECIHCIAGFVAYVITCSPAGMRIHTKPLEGALEATAKLLDAKGMFEKAPPALGGKSVTELLKEGAIKFDVDAKYPQALGITSILNRVSIFGNSSWEILQNEHEDSPFFTSDYPVAIEVTTLNNPIARVVPLAPDLAIRILPNLELARTKPDIEFPKFKTTRRRLKRADVLYLNRLFVRCAEDVVFYRDEKKWIEGFVEKNKAYRIEPVALEIPHGTGFLNITTQRVLTKRDNNR